MAKGKFPELWHKNMVEAHRKRWHKTLARPISNEMHEILEGLIASDAGMGKCFQARLEIYSKFNEFREHLAKVFGDSGFSLKRECKIIKNKSYYGVYIHACSDLTPYYDRWYAKGRKDIPDDFLVTPRSMLYWYLGDGGLRVQSRSLAVRISTYAFSSLKVVRMARMLQKQIGNRVCVNFSGKDGPVILMHGDSARAFLKYVGKCPVKCFKYKWKIPSRVERDSDLCRWTDARLIDLDKKTGRFKEIPCPAKS